MFGTEAQHIFTSQARQSEVTAYVNSLIKEAIFAKASDIHFESQSKNVVIRYRIDGTLQLVTTIPVYLALPIRARLKVMGHLNVTENRLPQDGRIIFEHDQVSVDLRISTLPTEFGESIVLRILNKSTASFCLEELGMPADMQVAVNQMLLKSSGLFLTTGPTGSGKTTTLYSLLKILNDRYHKIVTIEDPVEYQLEGLTQIAIREATGLSFASVLRSILRHDPDTIVIGEIRDPETAKLAVQAAITGHKVLATLHTYDAAGAITRLQDLGVEPFLVAACLKCVIAQRLLRILCSHCKTASQPMGCQHCNKTGYQGRLGVFELLTVNADVQHDITHQAALKAIRCKGMLNDVSLRCAAKKLIDQGVTSVSEMKRWL